MELRILGYPPKEQPQTKSNKDEVQVLKKELAKLRGQVGGLQKSNNILRGKLNDTASRS